MTGLDQDSIEGEINPFQNILLGNFPQINLHSFLLMSGNNGGSWTVQSGRYVFQFLYKYMFYNQWVYFSLTLPLPVYPGKGNLGTNKKVLQKLVYNINLYEYYSNTNVKNDANNNNHKIISDCKRNRTSLQSLKLKISRLFRARSPLTIECRFTLKRVRDLIITYSQQSNNLIWTIEKKL